MGGRRRPVVDRLLFGTGRAEEVAAIVTSWCATHLGSPVSSGRRWTTSVGSVAVVDLADGRIVVVKVHQPDATRQFLRAVQDVQRAVAVAGIAASSATRRSRADWPGRRARHGRHLPS